MWLYLEPGQGDLQRDIQRFVDHSGHRLDQRHEEQREPHDADEERHDHPSHPILHHLLLFLPSGLRVPLWKRARESMVDGGLM